MALLSLADIRLTAVTPIISSIIYEPVAHDEATNQKCGRECNRLSLQLRFVENLRL